MVAALVLVEEVWLLSEFLLEGFTSGGRVTTTCCCWSFLCFSRMGVECALRVGCHPVDPVRVEDEAPSTTALPWELFSMLNSGLILVIGKRQAKLCHL